MVAHLIPKWRAATVGRFIFGGSDPPYCILAMQDGKAGITTIPGELMGKSLSILHQTGHTYPANPVETRHGHAPYVSEREQVLRSTL